MLTTQWLDETFKVYFEEMALRMTLATMVPVIKDNTSI